MSLPAIKTFRDGREVCQANAAGRREYRERKRIMVLRQNFRCGACSIDIETFTAQFDHQDGRGSGGGHRDDRIEIDGKWHNAALCSDCNTRKGSVRYHWKDNVYVPSKAGEQPEGGKA